MANVLILDYNIKDEMYCMTAYEYECGNKILILEERRNTSQWYCYALKRKQMKLIFGDGRNGEQKW